MKHFLVLAAFLAVSAASVIPKDEIPAQCLVEWDQDGQCMTGQQTYTYDFSIGTCRAIDMYGCVGNDNVFTTEEECLSVCDKAERNAVKVVPSDAKFKINSFVDWVFGKISSGMKSVGADPIQVGGFALDQIPGLTLEFKDGSLTGLSNIVRVGDWGFDMQSKTKYSVYGGIGVHDVKGTFTAAGSLAGVSGEAAVTVSMNKFDVTFNFFVDFKECTIGLEKFTFGEGLEITVNIDTGSFLDSVMSETVSSATNKLNTKINEYVQKATLLGAGTVNLCDLFHTDFDLELSFWE